MSGIGAKTRIPVNENDSGVSETLITALANFIVPLTQRDTTTSEIGTDRSYTPGEPIAKDSTRSKGGAVRPNSGLTIEGQDLLIALKRFAESHMCSPTGEQTEQQLLGNLDQLEVESDSSRYVQPIDGWDAHMWKSSDFDLIIADVEPFEEWDAHMWESSGLGLIVTEADTERQQLIKRSLDSAFDVVFNNMPIRLLMFNQEGKGITLVERSQVMEILSAEINSDADISFPYRDWKFDKYAILSHTWLPRGEVTYSDWRNHTVPLDTQSPGYDKLAKFCEVAAKRGLRLGWMDTVCINKESSTELDESIRSMFKWYEGAEVCIAYLADTTSLDDIKEDKWFTRGWTLQELLAPHYIKFFSKNWTALSNGPADLSDKFHGPLVSKICDATGLDEKELSGLTHYLPFVPIWRKMQWAADRKVTREEDTAYSLMGIFNISMPTGYGEGAEHAFLRLVKEILNSKLTNVSKLEIVNWGSPFEHRLDDFRICSNTISSSSLIPRSPYAYMHASSNSDIHFHPSSSPITLSYMGLCVPVLLMPSRADRVYLGNSICPKGDYYAIFHDSSKIRTYKILDGTLLGSESTWGSYSTFAVLNIADETTTVLLPENGHCLAVELIRHKPLDNWEIPEDLQFQETPGRHHLTFDIICHNNSPFRIPKDELNRHGMTLRTMYL